MNQGTPENLELAHELAGVLTRLYAFLRKAILPKEMSLTQALVLATLRDRGPQRVTELAELQGVRQPTCTALLNAMEDEGWVMRRPDDSDRRAVIVELTGKGTGVLRSMTEARCALLQRYLGALTEGDRRALEGALPALKQLIDVEDASEVTAAAAR